MSNLRSARVQENLSTLKKFFDIVPTDAAGPGLKKKKKLAELALVHLWNFSNAEEDEGDGERNTCKNGCPNQK